MNSAGKFRLRNAQLPALATPSQEWFENRLVTFVEKQFPAECRKLGNDGVLRVIRTGRRRAQRYGIVSECDLGKYLVLMFEFGERFDTDQTWARRVLAGAPRVEPEKLIERLLQLAIVNENRALGL